MPARRIKAKLKKKPSSIYEGAFEIPEFKFLDELRDQTPDQFVKSVSGAGHAVATLFRGGHKRIILGLAHVYAVYACLQQVEAKRCKEYIDALARAENERMSSATGSRAKPSHELVYLIVRSMIDYGSYKDRDSARQAANRDANALRYADAMDVPFDGFLDFSSEMGLSADAMSRAYATYLKSLKTDTQAKPVSGSGGDSPANPGAGPPAATLQRDVTIEYEGRRTTISLPVHIGEGEGFHFFASVNSEGNIALDGTAPGIFDANGRPTHRSFALLWRAVTSCMNKARSADQAARVATEKKGRSGE